MASSTIVHAAVFAVGALVGGGVATAVASRNKPRDMLPPVPAQRPVPPIMDMKEGVLVKPPPGATVQIDTSVLKYGHPGARIQSSYFASREHDYSDSNDEGPVSDLLVRRAYITAYDRRLRHPAWVCLQFP